MSHNFNAYRRIWFLTWTTYGTWLPGDQRGFVSPKFEGPIAEKRHSTPGTEYDQGRPELRILAKQKLAGPPIFLVASQAPVLKDQFEETAKHRGWSILVGAIMPNHVHLVTGVPGDPDPEVLLRDFKSYGSRSLNRNFGRPPSDTWWTEQGSRRKVKDQSHLNAVVDYVKNQAGALVIWELGVQP